MQKLGKNKIFGAYSQTQIDTKTPYKNDFIPNLVEVFVVSLKTNQIVFWQGIAPEL